ncbi:MAG: hypothetical protein EXR76_05350 [Myxococcales bacterium]|nr:hypothetical protein [Myxococcales bacterium]
MRTVKGAKVVDLRAFRQRAERAADLQKTVAKREDLADLHPAHARYVYMQNQISVLFEQLTALPETRRLADRIEAAQDEYVPSGPPMSPLTTSYFTCWAFFDAAVSPQRETIGTCIVGLGKVLGMHPNFIALVQVMQDSCMRIYVHESFNAEGATNPRDLVSGARISCIVLSGWRGLRGEVWLARVFPPQVGTSDVSVVFTTPYVLPEASEHEWGDYFDRTLGAAKGDVNKTTAVLKYVIDWSEYIFAGYAGHATEAVFLKGLPDVPASLPHYSPRTR